MSSKVTIVLTVTPMSSGKSPNQWVTDVGAVPLDVGYMTGFLGCTLHSDATALNGFNQAARTIQINLTAAFKVMFPDASDQRAPWWNFMRGRIQARLMTPVLASIPVLT